MEIDDVDGEDPRARLLREVEAAVRQRAHGLLSGPHRGRTWNTTALLDEVWAELSAKALTLDWTRDQFLAAAVTHMKRVLCDAARRRQRSPVQSGFDAAVLDGPIDEDGEVRAELLDLDEALKLLAREKPRAARVVEYAYYVGCAQDEIARALGIEVRTVRRDLDFALAFLLRELQRGADHNVG
ncbi:MAG: ECF-type sigma factor [Planctomycetota bacterium]